MARPRNMANLFKPTVPVMKHNPTGVGQAGFDNARENIDPHVRTSAVTTKEGTIQDTPSNAKDIANKEYVDEQTTPIEFPADSIATITGTNTGGNVVSVQTKNDADTYDVDEVTGTPGFDIRVTFTGVDHFNTVKTQQQYAGSVNHTVVLQLWNKTSSDWDTIATVVKTDAQTPINIADINDGNYIDNGIVIVRYNHISGGNAAHDISIDYCSIWASKGGDVSAQGLWEVGDNGVRLKTSNAVDMQTKKIIAVVDPTTDQEAATKKYVDDEDAAADTHISSDGTDHADVVFNNTHRGDVTGDPHNIAADTLTFTNKTFDANAAGNSLSNVDHDTDLINVSADDHHSESHNIASHSDTSATGTELNSLTDNSMVDTLHRHSELSASDGTPDAVLVVDAAGIITMPSQSGCRVYLNEAQAVVRLTETKIEFDTKNWDIQTEFDTATNHRFVADLAGKYQVNVGLRLENITDGAAVQIIIKKNGAVVAQTQVNHRSTTATYVNLSDIINLSATDFIEAFTFHTDAANRDLVTGSHLTFMSIHKIS